MMATQVPEEEYNDIVITVCELIYGEGSLSPGGVEDVARIVEGVEIADKDVLDFGCGIGGPALALAKTYNARSVLGVDIGRTVLARAQEALRGTGLEDRVSFRLIEPGPLPLDDNSFDIVFSKDVLGGIEDKTTIYREMYRVLRFGGWFVGSDWTRGDQPESEAMKQFIDVYPLSAFIVSRSDTRRTLEEVGFTEIELRDRAALFKEWTLRELRQIEGPLWPELVRRTNEDAAQLTSAVWRAQVAALEAGDFCPIYIRARKPEQCEREAIAQTLC